MLGCPLEKTCYGDELNSRSNMISMILTGVTLWVNDLK